MELQQLRLIETTTIIFNWSDQFVDLRLQPSSQRVFFKGGNMLSLLAHKKGETEHPFCSNK